MLADKKALEPNADFMNSEKVVMHTTTDKDPRPLNKDRSTTGSLLDTSSSPLSGRKSRTRTS